MMGSRFTGLIVLLPFLAAGCGTVRIRNMDERPALRGEGERTAVLFVRGEDVPVSRSTRYFWGRRHTGRPERAFRELFGYVASGRGNLHLAPASDGSRRPEDLWPADEDRLRELIEGARERGIDYVLAAEIDSWRQSYILFVQWATIRFTMSCYAVRTCEEVWSAGAFSRRWYATDREVLIGVLEEMFIAP